MIDRGRMHGIQTRRFADRLSVALVTVLLAAATACSKLGIQTQSDEQPMAKAEPPEETGPDAAELQGLTEEAVIRLLGKPTGQMKTSSRATWDYPGYRIVFSADGKVTDAERKLRTVASTSSSGEVAPPIHKYSRGGAAVDIATLMPAGKITIVDFYADWCGPCARISPDLEAIAKTDPNVVLRKVDIVKWQTPVTKQYGIRSIPDIRIFDANKKLVGKAQRISDVKKLIAKAK